MKKELIVMIIILVFVIGLVGVYLFFIDSYNNERKLNKCLEEVEKTADMMDKAKEMGRENSIVMEIDGEYIFVEMAEDKTELVYRHRTKCYYQYKTPFWNRDRGVYKIGMPSIPI